MYIIGVDSETFLIQRGNLAPPMVCLSTAMRLPDGSFQTQLLDRFQALTFYRRRLADPNVTLVIHNGPFDLADACAEDDRVRPYNLDAACADDPTLIELVFDAYKAGRIVCTIVLQKLIDIALGMRKFRRYRGKVVKSTYGLADLIEMYYDEHVEKADTWRMSYALLASTPLEEWPRDAIDYAVKDAILHVRAYEAQLSTIQHNFAGNLPNQVEQQRAAWVLHLMSAWGVRADAAAVDKFIENCNVEIRKMHAALYDSCVKCGMDRVEHKADGASPICEFQNTGIFRKDKKKGLVRTMSEIRRRVVAAYTELGLKIPMTDPSSKFPQGQVQTDKEALQATNDPALHVLAESMTFVKHLGQWSPVCRAAVLRPICSRYEVLVETGRTACSGSEGQDGTNFQNPPRRGDVRPCFIARPAQYIIVEVPDNYVIQSGEKVVS